MTVLTARIPNYRERLDCALFIDSFHETADYVSERLGIVSVAVMEVTDSPLLKRLIEVVLAMGNYLNEGTTRGEAKAITLESIVKLDRVK